MGEGRGKGGADGHARMKQVSESWMRSDLTMIFQYSMFGGRMCVLVHECALCVSLQIDVYACMCLVKPRIRGHWIDQVESCYIVIIPVQCDFQMACTCT